MPLSFTTIASSINFPMLIFDTNASYSDIVGFGFYASVLIRAGYTNEGYLYGKLALKIMERYPLKEFESRILLAVWDNVMTEREPLRNCLGPYIKAHLSGMMTGDINVSYKGATKMLSPCIIAMYLISCLLIFSFDTNHYSNQCSVLSLCCHCALRFFVGDPLPSVLDELFHCRSQACLNLMGRGNSNPLVFVGEIVDENKLGGVSESWQRTMYLWSLHLKLKISVYMNDFEFAIGPYSSEMKKRDLGVVIPYVHKFRMFFEGIVAASFSRRSYIQSWRAQKRLKYLEKAALRCPENNASKVCLLKAELAASSRKYDIATLEYDKSI